MQIHYGLKDINIANPVVTIGSFDGVHKGHVLVVEGLKKCAQRLGGESVIISFDPHPREVLYPQEKAPGILTTADEKIDILERCGVQHLIILPFTKELAALSYDDFLRTVLVEKLHIRALIVGYDHRFGKNREGCFDTIKNLADQHGFYLEQEAVFEAHDINVSSTKIRKALEQGEFEQAQEFLGYSYSISGIVIHGDEIGRTLGFPTANIQLSDSRKLLPAPGVYAAQIAISGEEYMGMLNIGMRPTVTDSGVLRIEIHIFDFNRDIYGEKVTLTPLRRIRGERKFQSTEELRKQLETDKATILHIE